ncbi:hypothetical protein V3N95_03820 [Micrococcaceae bacterium Sec6.3]
MNTQQQTTTVPTGFTVRDWKKYHEGVDVAGDGYAEEKSWGIHDGPRSGSVLASWAPDRGFAFEVDPCGIDETMWGTMTPRQARRLAHDLMAVAEAVEQLQAPELMGRARALQGRGNATVSDLGHLSDEFGVPITTVYAAYEAAERETGQDD